MPREHKRHPGRVRLRTSHRYPRHLQWLSSDSAQHPWRLVTFRSMAVWQSKRCRERLKWMSRGKTEAIGLEKLTRELWSESKYYHPQGLTLKLVSVEFKVYCKSWSLTAIWNSGADGQTARLLCWLRFLFLELLKTEVSSAFGREMEVQGVCFTIVGQWVVGEWPVVSDIAF